MDEGGATMKMKVIGYWVTTALLSFAVVSGGAAELARRPDNVQGLLHLGYPVYFATIIGFWKVLGGLTVLAPRSRSTGAAASRERPPLPTPTSPASDNWSTRFSLPRAAVT